jgi:hypothetical protein
MNNSNHAIGRTANWLPASAPAERIVDAIAVLPLGKDRPRPPINRKAVIIEDGVWIGPNATILNGARGRLAMNHPHQAAFYPMSLSLWRPDRLRRRAGLLRFEYFRSETQPSRFSQPAATRYQTIAFPAAP